jgi:hypothetical protein
VTDKAVIVNLEDYLGPASMADFQSKATEVERQRVRRLVALLPTLDDAAFVDTAAPIAAQVVISESRRDTAEGPYLMNRACLGEARRRHQAAGHDPKCAGDNLYTEATNRTKRHFGFEPDSPTACTCGHEK